MLTRLVKNCVFVLLLSAGLAVASPAQTLTTLVDFTGANGNTPSPDSALVQGTDGNFYGVTYFGGANNTCTNFPGCGTIFKITPSGTLTTLYSFCQLANCTDGYFPSNLIQANDGNFYGTTALGGINTNCTANGTTGSCGTVFKITPGGALTTIYNFCSQAGCTDGFSPYARLVQASNGDLYGTTFFGGANTTCSGGCGTIFKITLAGALTTMHTFDGTDGGATFAAMIQASNSDLYGASTYYGPNGDAGTLFKMTLGGVFTSLYSFCSQTNCTDGAGPDSGLVQGADGELYGTTKYGGKNSTCTYGCGTIFKMTPSGTVTTGYYNFCSQTNCADGSNPFAGLIQADDGNFYGAAAGGASLNCTGGCGVLFKMTASGAESPIYSFCSLTNCPDGAEPGATLLQATSGLFYGSTEEGGTDFYDGTLFSFSAGLKAFVATEPTFGKIGSKVQILGQGFTGTTKVAFNGTAATFTVKSSTNITTTVPTGATTGSVTVKTPAGTLKSSAKFTVTP